jgi:hypothetical protein
LDAQAFDRRKLASDSHELMDRLDGLSRNTSQASQDPGVPVANALCAQGHDSAVEADDHGGELIIGEDEVALAVMAINEHAHRQE